MAWRVSSLLVLLLFLRGIKHHCSYASLSLGSVTRGKGSQPVDTYLWRRNRLLPLRPRALAQKPGVVRRRDPRELCVRAQAPDVLSRPASECSLIQRFAGASRLPRQRGSALSFVPSHFRAALRQPLEVLCVWRWRIRSGAACHDGVALGAAGVIFLQSLMQH